LSKKWVHAQCYMPVAMLRCTRTQYSVREWTPVMVSRVAPYRPAFWKLKNIVQAIKFGPHWPQLVSSDFNENILILVLTWHGNFGFTQSQSGIWDGLWNFSSILLHTIECTMVETHFALIKIMQDHDWNRLIKYKMYLYLILFSLWLYNTIYILDQVFW